MGLQHQPARARFLHRFRQIFRLVHRKNQDSRAQFQLGNLPRGLNSTHLRHGDVHEDHVGIELLSLVDGILSVDGLSHKLPLWPSLQNSTDSLPDHFMVVHNQNPAGHLLSPDVPVKMTFVVSSLNAGWGPPLTSKDCNSRRNLKSSPVYRQGKSNTVFSVRREDSSRRRSFTIPLSL